MAGELPGLGQKTLQLVRIDRWIGVVARLERADGRGVVHLIRAPFGFGRGLSACMSVLDIKAQARTAGVEGFDAAYDLVTGAGDHEGQKRLEHRHSGH